MSMKKDRTKQVESKKQYEAPAIVYEGMIATRAGTPFFAPPDNNQVDPADLFGSG